MAEISKPLTVGDSESLSSCCEVELRDLDTQKTKISNQEQSRAADSFVVDIQSLSHDHGSNSRLTVNMQRNLYRKGSERSENMTAAAAVVVDTGDEADGSSNGGSSYLDSTLRITSPFIASDHQEKISKEPVIKTIQVMQHQQEMTAVTSKESKLLGRRYGRHRSSSARLIDPHRIFFFLAALSSMGAIILIYFSLSIARLGDDHSSLQ